ncbi:hypothetical protein [Streptomyces sp. NPDC004285]
MERIDARERELVGDAEQIRAQMDELTARLREHDEEIGNLAVTRKALLALPPAAPEPTEEPPSCRTTRPTSRSTTPSPRLLGRSAPATCAKSWTSRTPKTIESTRHKLKRLVSLGVLTETEPGLFAQRRP